MEINITSLLEADCFPLSHSQAEGGPNSARNTWQASKELAEENVFLDTEEKLEEMREYVAGLGGWDREEIATWDAEELNAFLLQTIASEVRQAPLLLEDFTFTEKNGKWTVENDEYFWGPYDSRLEAYGDTEGSNGRPDSLEEIDWLTLEADENKSGRIYKGDDGEIYIYIGF